jgi:hypothetical protein
MPGPAGLDIISLGIDKIVDVEHIENRGIIA